MTRGNSSVPIMAMSVGGAGEGSGRDFRESEEG